jgi:KDO2-lipid IV(A) lauroyltransferase
LNQLVDPCDFSRIFKTKQVFFPSTTPFLMLTFRWQKIFIQQLILLIIISVMFGKAFSYLGIFFLAVLSFLPLQILYGLAHVVYFSLYYLIGYRKSVVRSNLKNAFPERTAVELLKIEKQFYRYLSDLTVEIIKMNTISKRELRKRYVFRNADIMESYFRNGENVLVCAAHYGNWEWGNMALGLSFSAKNYAIYKPLSNPVFNYWFKRIRSRFGNRMVPMRQTFRALATSTSPSIFSFGNDQAPGKDESHYWTRFLNQQTSFQLGIEKIAKKTNRPIFYLQVKVLTRGYYEVNCIPLCLSPNEAEKYELTELHVRLLEDIIKEEPAYWLWSHRRWKYQPKEVN